MVSAVYLMGMGEHFINSDLQSGEHGHRFGAGVKEDVGNKSTNGKSL
eukprot:CAMPEP_0198225090 /NCGR_PEP_ID=MMETSP1445-20131203/99610_1 /TAXON_ID=36898 /ORGANISM="Pyramimonas sp., Strain CCMP2087" /LENGTH=46 /DNA_ID= /DNA_START= /DNA_END= /DNA_ORIENTATION=